jgi:hypothetical protein
VNSYGISMKHGAVRAFACAIAIASAMAAPAAVAWNDTGHLVIALAAYDALPQQVQLRLDEVVGAFPRYRADFVAPSPEWVAGAPAASQRRWYFAFASTWPDRARRFAHVRDAGERAALVRRYDRPTWHYVNLPTYLAPADRRTLALPKPPLAAPESTRDANLNIVQALGRLERDWREASTDAERALALAWISHLVADLHQPLHATALYAVGVLEKGDRGGNLIGVGSRDDLHGLWDAALGSGRRQQDLERARRALTIATAAAPGAIDFAAWARESRTLADTYVYPAGLRTSLEAQRRSAGRLEVSIDDRYRDDMRALARERGAVAAVRLAAVLTALTRGAVSR